MAVSVTCVPGAKLPVQTVPQVIPAGVLVTVSPPVPESCTIRAYEFASALKFAITETALFIATVHVPVPLHAPPQPANVEVPDGMAASET